MRFVDIYTDKYETMKVESGEYDIEIHDCNNKPDVIETLKLRKQVGHFTIME